MSELTEGPWEAIVYINRDLHVWEAGRFKQRDGLLTRENGLVAIIKQPSSLPPGHIDTYLPIAQLIAVSPDLLEACKTFMDAAHRGGLDYPLYREPLIGLKKAVALALAEGKPA